jgi:hypothetical protein
MCRYTTLAWCVMGGSNTRLHLGKVAYYRCTNNAWYSVRISKSRHSACKTVALPLS